jgi:hypothetical protein
MIETKFKVSTDEEPIYIGYNLGADDPDLWMVAGEKTFVIDIDNMMLVIESINRLRSLKVTRND